MKYTTEEAPFEVETEEDFTGGTSHTDGTSQGNGDNRFFWLLVVGGIGGMGLCGCSLWLSLADVEWLNFFASILQSLRWQLIVLGFLLSLYWAVIWFVLSKSLERLLLDIPSQTLGRLVSSLKPWILDHPREVSYIAAITTCLLALIVLPVAFKRPLDIYDVLLQIVINFGVGQFGRYSQESAGGDQTPQTRISLISRFQLLIIALLFIAVACSQFLYSFISASQTQ